MAGPELTPEMLAQLELHTEEGDNYPLPLRSHTVQALIAAARERDHLRERAILKAWSGSLSGLDAADAASARAAALEALGGLEAITYEQQRDAAMTKLAAVLAERDQLRREVAQLRDMLAAAKAEIAQLRHPLACRPPEDAGLRVEHAQLRIEVDRLRAIGLEAVKILDRCGVATNLRAEIERKL